MKSSLAAPKDIDDYLARLPEAQMIALEKLRHTIRQAAPQATELISYQIPAFRQDGMLVGFAAFKNHCAFYLMSPALMSGFTEELKGYKTATATIHFQPDNPLPAALIKKMVKARIKENGLLRKKKKS